MAEKDGERSFLWTLIKYGAMMTALDHIFPTKDNNQYTEYEKKSIEKNQKISDLNGVISKYNSEIEELKYKLGESVFNKQLRFEDETLNGMLKDLNELTESLNKKQNDLKQIKIFSL